MSTVSSNKNKPGRPPSSLSTNSTAIQSSESDMLSVSSRQRQSKKDEVCCHRHEASGEPVAYLVVGHPQENRTGIDEEEGRLYTYQANQENRRHRIGSPPCPGAHGARDHSRHWGCSIDGGQEKRLRVGGGWRGASERHLHCKGPGLSSCCRQPGCKVQPRTQALHSISILTVDIEQLP